MKRIFVQFGVNVGGLKEAMAEPKVNEYLEKFLQLPWYKNPAEYRAFAEKYYVDVKPLLIKAGLAQG